MRVAGGALKPGKFLTNTQIKYVTQRIENIIEEISTDIYGIQVSEITITQNQHFIFTVNRNNVQRITIVVFNGGHREQIEENFEAGKLKSVYFDLGSFRDFPSLKSSIREYVQRKLIFEN